jgi:Glycosyltransferase (GlcNAc)
MPSVFVSIANYRDSEVKDTVNSLMENTTSNVTLNISVYSQCYVEERIDLPLSNDNRRIVVKQTFVNPDQSRGLCWARAEIQREYSSEDFYLQLDSHVELAPRWDEILLRDYANAATDRPVVLTAYLPDYERVDGQRLVREKRPTHFRVVQNGWRPEARQLLGYPHARPCRAFFFSGHFAFARGRFVEDVPSDPEIFFIGDEISIAVRAYSCGYDLRTPSQYVGAHLARHYPRSKPGLRPLFWDPEDDAKRSLSSVDRNIASLVKVGAICRGEARGLYGIQDQSRYVEFRRLLRDRYGVELERADPRLRQPGNADRTERSQGSKGA